MGPPLYKNGRLCLYDTKESPRPTSSVEEGPLNFHGVKGLKHLPISPRGFIPGRPPPNFTLRAAPLCEILPPPEYMCWGPLFYTIAERLKTFSPSLGGPLRKNSQGKRGPPLTKEGGPQKKTNGGKMGTPFLGLFAPLKGKTFTPFPNRLSGSKGWNSESKI